MGFGAVFIFLFLLARGKAPLLVTMSGAQWGWVLFTAALLLGYVLTWYVGLKQVPVTVATCILLLGSPITTLLQLANGTPLVLTQGLGMIAILFGLALAIKLARIQSPTPQTA